MTAMKLILEDHGEESGLALSVKFAKISRTEIRLRAKKKKGESGSSKESKKDRGEQRSFKCNGGSELQYSVKHEKQTDGSKVKIN